MELRVLRYFLAVAQEENITNAAELLHVTQPTLSKQLMDFEKELGKKLFIRGNRKITLTEEGLFLRKRAQEIIDLADKTEAEFGKPDDVISGDIYIGGGETDAMRIIAKNVKKIQAEYPLIRYHLFSGDADIVKERLDKGLLDFGIVIEPVDIKKYDYIRLLVVDVRGLLMRKDSPLAALDNIKPEHLLNIPLICSGRIVKYIESCVLCNFNAQTWYNMGRNVFKKQRGIRNMNKKTLTLTVEQYYEIIDLMQTGFAGCHPSKDNPERDIIPINLKRACKYGDLIIETS